MSNCLAQRLILIPKSGKEMMKSNKIIEINQKSHFFMPTSHLGKGERGKEAGGRRQSGSTV